jgi:DNA-binding SARP family transcriptional activator/predicted ATPase
MHYVIILTPRYQIVSIMTHITISLFGSFQVRLGEIQVTSFRSDKVRGLLAYLAVETNQPHRRDALAGLLWPELPEQKAHDNLRLVLHRLRGALAGESSELPQAFLQITPKTIQLNLAAECQVDVGLFTGQLTECRAHRHPRPQNCSWCATRMAQAVELYRGDLLEGFFLDSQPFEEWLLVRREGLRNQALEALYALAEYAECNGDYAQAQRYARRQLQIDAWNEGAHYQLMRALALAGQRSAALAQYQTCTGLLEKELGAEPGDEMRSLYEQLLAGQKLLPESAGTRREQVSSFPSLATPFIGRQEELALVEAALEDTQCRVLTVVGPGGVGKSRLAIQAGRAQAGTRLHGAHFIPLAGVDAPDFLTAAIAHAIRFSFHGRGDIQAQLLGYLRDREMLLVLDNFEHLIEGAPLLEKILAHAAGVKLLVTSRQRLKLEGERTLILSGLGYPSDGQDGLAWHDLEEFSAIGLFSEIASRLGVQLKSRQKDWPAIAHICQLVEGLPLGVELAAAWLKLLSPQEIAREIERDLNFLAVSHPELPERHHSLQAVCDTSWRLLAEEERSVLSSLSVFRGGFTLEAARQVAGATPHLLSALADKSLLRRRAENYFDIQELLRQYAENRLCELPEKSESARQRHCTYYRAFVAQRKSCLEQALKRGERSEAILEEFDQESDNLQASWHWLLRQPGEAANIEAYIEGLGLVYDYQGRPQEAARLYELGLGWEAEFAQPPNQPRQARWEYCLGKAYLNLGMVERGKQQLETALKRLGQRLPSTPASLSLAVFGQVALQALLQILPGRFKNRRKDATAQTRLDAERAFANLMEVSYLSNQRQYSIYYALRVINMTEGGIASPEQAHTEANICFGAGMLGLHRLAGFYYQRARQSAQSLEDALTRAYVFQATGIYDIGLGRWESARQALSYAAGVFKRLGYQRQWGECVMPQTIIASAQGQISRSTELLDHLLVASRESGDLLQQGWAIAGQAHRELLDGQMENAIAGLQNYLEISQQVSHLPGIITANGLLAVARLHQEEYVLARQSADAAALQISNSSHTVFTNAEGYSAVVEAYLGLLVHCDNHEGGERKTLLRQTSQVLKAMQIQARGVPAGLSRYWLLLGLYHWLTGAQRQAFKDWHKCLADARRLQMPFDQGRACYEIGRHLPPDHPQRQTYLKQACELLEQLGAIYYLRRAQVEVDQNK